MGVHITFVRAVDLDEWTQGQLDAMRLGGVVEVGDRHHRRCRRHLPAARSDVEVELGRGVVGQGVANVVVGEQAPGLAADPAQ